MTEPTSTTCSVTSSNPEAVSLESVLGYWVAVAKAPGTAVITATDGAGRTGTLTLTVEATATEPAVDLTANMEIRQEMIRLINEVRAENGGFMKHAEDFKRISDEMARLKEQKVSLLEQQNSDSAASQRIADAVDILNAGSAEFTEWNESLVRQLVDTVKVLSADRIKVYLRGGMEIEQELEK